MLRLLPSLNVLTAFFCFVFLVFRLSIRSNVTIFNFCFVCRCNDFTNVPWYHHYCHGCFLVQICINNIIVIFFVLCFLLCNFSFSHDFSQQSSGCFSQRWLLGVWDATLITRSRKTFIDAWTIFFFYFCHLSISFCHLISFAIWQKVLYSFCWDILLLQKFI